jgi:DNA-binding transcriptional ArsR family regulator
MEVKMHARTRAGDESLVVKGLAALAQPLRLRAFRALVVAGRQGLTPGALCEELDVAATTLSFHLKELAHAGLVSQERDGRHLIYRASFDRMNLLLDYLTAHCCAGEGCDVVAACCSPS